jgi:prefoldin alpha subunit
MQKGRLFLVRRTKNATFEVSYSVKRGKPLGNSKMAYETNEREVNVGQMSIEQLNQLKVQHENEIRELQGQLETLHGAKNRFIGARLTLDEMKKMPETTPLLVPLNGSLYVPGTIASSDRVIVELGTGYFCEKNVPDAKDLIDRKMILVDKSIESIESIGNKKRKNLEQIMQVSQQSSKMCVFLMNLLKS